MSGNSGTGSPPAALLRALKVLLRPLVRGLMAHGLSFPQLSDLLKQIYVDVANRELSEAGEPQTQSRISLATGVHRKDVKRLSGSSDDAPSARASSLGSRIVGVWAGSPDYADPDGHPVPLPRRNDDAGVPTFESLVRSVSTDLRARAILDEWLRLGVVHIDSDDRVCLNADAFVPRAGFDESAHFFGRNLRDHVAASTENLFAEEPRHMERAVFYDALTPKSVVRLESLARKLGNEALLKVNREALRLADEDAGDANAARRMTFGVYFYETRDVDTPTVEDGDE
ncbi:MAG: DUF6502 family protein [Proteobacteria bacterium]|nr:DUF6502 family protein [Pseudomonadota bacterium]MDA1057077.1 DUF6502 family protein [Pseudomonadota bacterium]